MFYNLFNFLYVYSRATYACLVALCDVFRNGNYAKDHECTY